MEGSPNTSADIFANSSAETVAENESKVVTVSAATELEEFQNCKFPPAPFVDAQTETSLLCNDTSAIVNEFITETGLPVRICCPFCILDFGFQFILKDHIKKSHPRELKIVLKCDPGYIKFHQCPFCKSKFYFKELLPKHVIRKHELCVVNMFSGFSPEKYVYCRFCPHKSLRKHYKLLMIHIEQKHFKLFEKFIISKYSNITTSFEDILNLDQQKKVVENDSPGLSKALHKLTTSDTKTTTTFPRVKSILKPATAYPLDKSENVITSSDNVNYANLNVRQHKCQRMLRFDLPDSPEEDKENLPKKMKLATKPRKWKISKLKSDSLCEPLKSEGASRDQVKKGLNTSPQMSQFMCGLCSEAFDINVKLLEHIRYKHKGLKLQAQYKCGECKAKFYRNSFLVRHCWFHHGPLCLKSPSHKKSNSLKF